MWLRVYLCGACVAVVALRPLSDCQSPIRTVRTVEQAGAGQPATDWLRSDARRNCIDLAPTVRSRVRISGAASELPRRLAFLLPR